MRLALAILFLFTINQVVLADETSLQKDEPIWIDKTMEDMVTPLKQWLEYKNQPQTDNLQPAQVQQHTMRQAIKQATKQYPGMVLSVKKDKLDYQVKILSKDGVVKLINIPGVLPKAGQ